MSNYPAVPARAPMVAAERGLTTVRIVVADDHLVYRIGIRSLIEAVPGFTVVGEASNSDDTLAIYRALRPDVLLLDLRMPQREGIDTVRCIRAEFPEAKILIVTSYQTTEEIVQVMRAGALGYILKDLDRTMLVDAIRSVCAGRTWISPGVQQQMAEGMTRQPLTSRELDVLRLLARGLTNREIANVFKIAESTVKNHVNHLLMKLDVADRTEAVSFCLTRGIVRLEDL